ncbi:MAG: diaminopimelate decarboxylase [Coriobacteriales bacterium]|jgi:diaminopimelate decarboxylase|nr:diaminopimelate decarboxylase [Coriobacteriales bacterium]
MAQIAHNPDARPDYKSTLDLGAVLPQTAEVKGGHLWIGGVDTVTLAREFGTALYVMDEEHIRTQLRNYLEWTRYHWKDVDVVYAGKAFISIAMCKLVEEEGCYLDVSSGGELAVAQAAGFPASRILAHGNNKTLRELVEAIDAGVGRIVVDSLEELARINGLALERGLRQPILIRVTPGVVADTHQYIQTGSEDSKFGFGLRDGLALAAIQEALALPGVELKGLHMHIGSQIFALHSYAKAIEVIVHFMDEIREKTGFTVSELDTGGGLGIAYGVPDEPSTIKEFGKVIVDDIKEHCEQHALPVPRILVEPGRSIVANAGVSLYIVGTIKAIPNIRTYVAVDGGMTDNIRPALYGAHYEPIIANKADQPRDTVVTIAGKHCESGDVLVVDTPLQAAEVGDTLCIFATGAYCQTMSSNYNKQVRPGVVFVRDGRARLVVRRESYDDLLRCEVSECL